MIPSNVGARISRACLPLIWLMACTSELPRTQIMTIIDGDSQVQSRADALQVEVYGRSGTASEWSKVSFDERYEPLPGLPLRVAVVPRGGDKGRQFRVVAIAEGPGGYSVRAQAIGSFQAGQTLAVDLYLDDRCGGVSCDELLETCRAGTCEDAQVEKDDLRPYKERDVKHREPDAAAVVSEPDSGAGTDAAQTDSGQLDSGPDGSTACVPSEAVDAPDVNGIDSDCDGIDGVASDAIFVDVSLGNDTNAGTSAAPVATIARGVDLAVAQAKRAVLVAGGDYTSGVTLANGVDIHGSYTSETWARALVGRSPSTIISAASPTIVGEDITSPTRISGIRVVASDAVVPGQSSIAVLLVDASGLTVEDSTLRGGGGADGALGTANASIPTVGMMGNEGLPAACNGDTKYPGCTNNPNTQSARYTSAPCGCGRGGGGGWAWSDPSLTRVGFAGTERNALGACVDSVGLNGLAASGNGGTGWPGAMGAPGSGGAPGTRSAAAFTAAGYAPASGAPGGTGMEGGGGGAGASGEPRWCSTTASTLKGGTGAMGGSGGCGGAGGGGGGGGGLSVALFLWRSVPTVVRVSLSTSAAGDGGAGAGGVVGAAGGPGGSSATTTIACPAPDNAIKSTRGGAGATGGQGGTGGAGGGGAAGVSGAIVVGEDAGLNPSSWGVTYEIPGAVAVGGGGGAVGPVGLSCNAFRVADAACLAGP